MLLNSTDGSVAVGSQSQARVAIFDDDGNIIHCVDKL